MGQINSEGIDLARKEGIFRVAKDNDKTKKHLITKIQLARMATPGDWGQISSEGLELAKRGIVRVAKDGDDSKKQRVTEIQLQAWDQSKYFGSADLIMEIVRRNDPHHMNLVINTEQVFAQIVLEYEKVKKNSELLPPRKTNFLDKFRSYRRNADQFKFRNLIIKKVIPPTSSKGLNYICQRCGYSFKGRCGKQNFKAHISKKKICKPTLADVERNDVSTLDYVAYSFNLTLKKK